MGGPAPQLNIGAESPAEGTVRIRGAACIKDPGDRLGHPGERCKAVMPRSFGGWLRSGLLVDVLPSGANS